MWQYSEQFQLVYFFCFWTSMEAQILVCEKNPENGNKPLQILSEKVWKLSNPPEVVCKVDLGLPAIFTLFNFLLVFLCIFWSPTMPIFKVSRMGNSAEKYVIKGDSVWGIQQKGTCIFSSKVCWQSQRTWGGGLQCLNTLGASQQVVNCFIYICRK